MNALFLAPNMLTMRFSEGDRPPKASRAAGATLSVRGNHQATEPFKLQGGSAATLTMNADPGFKRARIKASLSP